MTRDEFNPKVKQTLAGRVNLRCSICRAATSGPHSNPERVVNVGVAAHITGAAPGGPRFDPSLSKGQRSGAANGIWLCQNCAKLVDNDDVRYPTDTLRRLKQRAEQEAEDDIGQGSTGQRGSRSAMPHVQIPNIGGLPYLAARADLIALGWQPINRHWSDASNLDISGGNGPFYWNQGCHEIVSASGTGAAACVFAFTDVYGNRLLVMTEGESYSAGEAEALVVHWRLSDPIAVQPPEPTPSALVKVLHVAHNKSPPNILDVVQIGTTSPKVRERLGVPDVIDGSRWKYRYLETEVQIAFNAHDAVESVVIALIHGQRFHGTDAPFGDYVLGELTLQDLYDMGYLYPTYRDSMRTKELCVHVRVGPAGAWNECFFGAMVILTGVGWLAETSFQWNIETTELLSPASQTKLNWIGINSTTLEAPYFDWYIKS